MEHKILMIDDDLQNIKAIKNYLEKCGFQVKVSLSAKEVFENLLTDEFSLILIDYHMPEIMGYQLSSLIREKYPHQQIAMLSCDLTREAVKQSLRSGADDFIEKCALPTEILSRVQYYCDLFEKNLKTIRKSNSKPDSNLNVKLNVKTDLKSKKINSLEIKGIGLIGVSDAMVDVAKSVQKVALISDVSVLIRGESGTGKELIAKAVHELSFRKNKPFVAINCAAIPKELLESELFGHKKGSFTGAINDKEGKCLAANGGTIFLDEIGDMPLELQAKLLRVLQERTVEQVGSHFSKKIDVRIISATHKDLDKLVKDEKFRADLMFRLNAIEIEIPPLRDRSDDIEPLVEHFTEKFNTKNKTQKYFQRRTLEALRAYGWPGNVRELENVVERNLVLTDSMVTTENLTLEAKKINDDRTGSDTTKLSDFENTQQKQKLDFIYKIIKQVGTKAEAARRLGIKPNHLQYLIAPSKT